MIINHNLNAMNAHRNMGINTGNAAKSMEKLSSGLRINRAGDDAAGLSISEKMRAQIRGLDQASRNAQDGISLIQTAEGSLNETHSILQRMRELAVQASNDTNVTVDRSAITDELTSLQTEVDRIAKTTQFNEKNLLDGSLSGGGSVSGAVLQIGANSSTDLALEIKIDKMDAASLGITTASINVTSNTFARTTIDNVNSAIKLVSTQRSKLGAYQNRLEHTINNLDNASENLQAAESRVRDVDMAKEMMEYSKNNILQQAAQSMLSQANQAPQGVLNLLR
ncbi:flagellin [Clostridium beijerinckii]|uniref:Flagellin n=1 Tax=Clostridium beijerinckii TaxID=1520 RepID=A0AAE5H1W8_CLOBE|nr:flagellin [Clostridium beijerinckii]NSB12952.1 flagellin [Clostridium beijerinckii]OOM28251.1 flagellin [Clostridium beijerinckii]